jgi:hypothetical protein
LYPTFFTACWVIFYGAGGMVLRIARALDVGFTWFNRRFDIENQPLKSIGLVAGVLVAIVYWTAVVVSRVMG